MLCLIAGFLLGAGIGCGFFLGDSRHIPTPWQVVIGKRIRSTQAYNSNFVWYCRSIWHRMSSLIFDSVDMEADIISSEHTFIDVNGRIMRDDPSHPLRFAVLRESIIREDGFVHPDLGLLVPAPSGATRGLGMVRDTYNSCQTRCFPGVPSDSVSKKVRENHAIKGNSTIKDALNAQMAQDKKFSQTEILLKVPLSMQMTRSLALKTLLPLIPAVVNSRVPLQELDDAGLLVLLLAHERGLGRESKFLPYISTLPLNPSCGYSPLMRSEALEAISIMRVEMEMDVNGWSGEIAKAAEYAEMIADGLARDYGEFISIPNGVSPFATLQWALCQVASRATAGSEHYGNLRLIPMVDLINHDVNAGGFEELNGHEHDKFLGMKESDSGAFIVRSIRLGRRKPLKKGQELLVNYNVPDYSPLDWFISLGFVPPEKHGKWTRMNAALPKMRNYNDFGRYEHTDL